MIRARLALALRWLAFGVLLLAAAAIREGPSPAVDQAIIWLPTGVSIAGLWLLGLRAWPVVTIATVIQRWHIGYDWGVGLGAAAGSTLEGVLGVLVLRRLGFQRSLERVRDVGAVFAAAAIAPFGSMLMSWVGRSYVWAHRDMPFYSGWDGWWRMNALGALTVVPAALLWLGLPRARFTPRFVAGLVAGLLALAALLATLVLLLPAGAPGVMWMNLVLMGVAMFAAVRFGVPGAALATLVEALAVSAATLQGLGPFPGLPHEQRHVVVQLFELTLVAIPPVFAALMSERRAADERRRRSEDLLESINRNVNEGLFRADADLRLGYANLALARMLGRESPDDILGQRLSDAFVDPTRPVELMALARAGGPCLNEEARFRRPDGSTFWGLVTATAVRDPQGAVVHYDGAIADVTARKALEEQFRQAQKMEAVGKLAGGVAHDFNNMLTVIIGYAESVRAEAAAPALKRYATSTLEAATRAAALTQQLLAYGRRQMLSPRVIELTSAVDRMSEMVRRIIGEDVHFVVAHRSGPCWVKVDPGQLEQVLMNLVVNARDAMHGGGTLTISTALEEIDADVARVHPDRLPGTCVLLRVADTGEGMTPEVLERAFDPFFTTKELGHGTGLGLATVYGIAKQSGGAAWLDSAPGRGTTATIQLPRESAPEAATPSVSAGTRQAAVSPGRE